MPPDGRKVLLIGLDAADPLLVERWISEGSLPHLARLKASGAHGRIRTPAKLLAGSPWPTFYTGSPPSEHGIYHDYQWRHERLRFETPLADWLPARPFWRGLGPELSVVAYDVPMVQGCAAFGGFEVSGWASHDKLQPAESWPRELLGEIRARFGAWPNRAEEFGPAELGDLLDLHGHLLDNTRHSSAVASWLLERPWDLGIVVFSALHPGGHRLWDRSSIRGSVSEEEGRRFDEALRSLYAACDDAVGALLAREDSATVIVFSLHGMQPNSSRADFLDPMLARILRGGDGESRPGKLRRLGEAIPLSWRRFLTRHIPSGLRSRLMTLWATGGIRWEQTRAFSLRADLQGYVRINLKGREPRGVVEPGEGYDELCLRLAEGLESFRDATTGEPIVEEVARVDRIFPDGRRRDRLPDLIVRWSETAARFHEAIESARHGRIERATPGRIPNGRS